MPTYIYRCESCNETFERTESIVEHETAKPPCPTCNSEKVIQVPAPFMAITGKKS
ncbi:MAG: FmdB family zinc ribbon protein [Geminicoccaceae bacterium]